MPVRTGSPAPYGPPQGVMDVVLGYRDRGLPTPFTADVLLRAGISESLVPRVLKSLETLDLIDKDGHPTAELVKLRTVPTSDFQARLAEVVRAAYAEVFQFVDPTVDDATRVADAFRLYEPAGQRGRMVTLFLGLCEASGIIAPSTKRSPASVSRPANKSRKPVPPAESPKGAMDRAFAGPAGTRAGGQLIFAADPHRIPSALIGVLSAVPAAEVGWTKAKRDQFMTAFGYVLDLVVPVVSQEPETGDDEDGQ